MSRGRVVGQKASEGGGGGGVEGQQAHALSDTDLAELWEWAPVEANQEARQRNWGGNFTLEERELGLQNVVTGLKRELEDDEEEEEEEEGEGEGEGEEMEIVGARKKSNAAGLEFDIASRPTQGAEIAAGPAMPLDDVLRFMTSGMPPKQR